MKKTEAIDLGVLQKDVVNASTNLRNKNRALRKAKDDFLAAEQLYASAQKALSAGVESVMAATKNL